MEQQYSTLELTKHDETTRAPERDYDATAFELDPDALAPQVVPDTTPQVVYDSSVAEAQDQIEDAPQERASSHTISQAGLKWLWITVTLVVATVIAVGAGIGTWYHREHLHKPSTTTSPPASHNHSSPASHNHSSIAPHNQSSAAQHILNDTSLAALTLPNGDRQLLFQDSTGLIRRAVWTASNAQWDTMPYLNFSSGLAEGLPTPKNNTPLAFAASDAVDGGGTNIEVYYVSDSHHLSSSVAEGSGNPIQELGENFSTAVDTRSLSVTSVPGSGALYPGANPSGNSALLYYENSAGNLSALLQRYDPTTSGEGVHWYDITSQSSQSLPGDFHNDPSNSTFHPPSHTLYESLTGIKLGTPFTSMANYSDGDIKYGMSPGLARLGAVFVTPGGATIQSAIYYIGLNGSGNYVTASAAYVADPSIHLSDVAVFGPMNQIWINGTQPVTYGAAPPNVSFPFSRLASVYSADQSTTYLYHQINGTTLAEEQWDDPSQTWSLSHYITVSES